MALKIRPVQSESNLRERILNLFRAPVKRRPSSGQFSLDLGADPEVESLPVTPAQDVRIFLDFVSSALPDGDVYLFGGIIRDLAIHGGEEFDSDIDLVVEGEWSNLISYISKLGASRNKFGGYRFRVGVGLWICGRQKIRGLSRMDWCATMGSNHSPKRPCLTGMRS